MEGPGTFVNTVYGGAWYPFLETKLMEAPGIFKIQKNGGARYFIIQ